MSLSAQRLLSVQFDHLATPSINRRLRLMVRLSLINGILPEMHGNDVELKLPKRSSLCIMLMMNILLQVSGECHVFQHSHLQPPKVSFFIIVSSSAKYAEYLGGSPTFSGLVIGIPTVFGGLALIPMTRFDRGKGSCLGSSLLLSNRYCGSRWIRFVIARWLLLSDSWSYRLCHGLSDQVLIHDSDRTLFERDFVHGFHVCQTILHRSPHRGHSPKNHLGKLPGHWTGAGHVPWPVPWWSVIQDWLFESHFQRIHQPRLGHGQCLCGFLGFRCVIFRGRSTGD